MITENAIFEMKVSELLSEEFIADLCDLSECDRVRMSELASVRAKELGVKSAFGKIFKAIEKETCKKPLMAHRDENRRFLHHRMAQGLIDEGKVAKIDGSLMFKLGNVWRGDVSVLNELIIERCPDTTKTNRQEVLAWLQASGAVPQREISAPELIPFANGVLDLNGEDHVRPYSEDDVFTLQYPIAYRPDVERQYSVDAMLKKLSDGSKDVADLICQMFGLLFFRENRFRASFFLYGESGNNGKSTVCSIVTQLAGKENCSSMQLQDWDGDRSRFRVAELQGKAVNLCDDLSARHIWDSSLFKAIATGGRITAERKGENPFSFSPFAKLIFACNELPTASDHSGGMVSRMVIVPLEHDFSHDADFDPTMKDRRLTEDEKSWLTVLAVQGLRKVIRSNGVVVPSESRALLNEYQRCNDPIASFLGYCDSTDFQLVGAPTDTVFEMYRAHCEREGFKGDTKRQTVIKRICIKRGLEAKRYRIGGEREYRLEKKWEKSDELPF